MRNRRKVLSILIPAAMAALLLSLPAAGLAASKLAEGTVFPHFKAKDIAGNPIDTKQYATGKALLLDFWSIYCSSCLQEMPFIIQIYNKFKDKGLTALSVDLDAFAPKRVQKFIDGLEFKIPYPTIIDDKREIQALLSVSILPTVILVDPAGKVRLFHVGYKPGFENELEKIVQEVLPK